MIPDTTRTPTGELRARGLGVPLPGVPGPANAITDVAGLEVGYATLIAGDGPLRSGVGPIRTGVTTVLPLGKDRAGTAVAAGYHSLNGNGEMTGTAWIAESGQTNLPIGISNTHAIGPVHRGIIDWSLARHPHLGARWLMPVAAETWDGYLNDTNGRHVTEDLVAAALDSAGTGPLREGSVGGGTGMTCYGFKGGTGTSSRVVDLPCGSYTVGALMQANFGSREELSLRGRPIGQILADDDPLGSDAWLAPAGTGSCITIIATDAPLLPGQLSALARRVPLGLARTGTTGSHFSGDLFLALSTANAGQLDAAIDDLVSPPTSTRHLDFVPWALIDPLYTAVVEAVEECVWNVLAASREMVGRDGHRAPGFPVQRMSELLGPG
jgi:D-aminopeptidase